MVAHFNVLGSCLTRKCLTNLKELGQGQTLA